MGKSLAKLRTFLDAEAKRATNDTTGAYRLFPAESISFGQRLRFTIQHGPTDDQPANYSSVAFWYGQSTYSLQVTDALNTTDQASRASHSYMVTGDRTSPLTSTLPGEFNYIPVTLGLDTASTAISFRMAINPANNGVRLTRVSDQLLSYQTANVYIDGIFAGTWMEPWNNPDSRWLNDLFDISGNPTGGKQAINVLLVPLTGPTGTSVWAAAHYEVTSEVAPFTDTTNLGPITGLAATGSVNSINLSWEPDTNGIGVVSYQVYGSMDSSVPVKSSTLVGQPPVPGFQHTGLGLEQQWYYRVRAVDGNGHLGPISGVGLRPNWTIISSKSVLCLPVLCAASAGVPGGYRRLSNTGYDREILSKVVYGK